MPSTRFFGRRNPITGPTSSPRPRGTSRVRSRWSAMLTVEACTRTSSSSAFGSGLAASTRCTTSGGPKRSADAARMVVAVAVAVLAMLMAISLTV
jgi:hypothetical protein